MKSSLLFILPLLIAWQSVAAAPQEITFSQYRREMGFILSMNRTDKSDLMVCAVRFDPSFGPRASATVELFMAGNSLGRFDLFAAQVGDATRLVAFSLSSKFSGTAVLSLRHEDLADPAFKIDLSTWPVKTVSTANH